MKLLSLLNPSYFIKIANKIQLVLILLAIISFGLGMYYSLHASPEDYQQGEMVRIMYIHVPSAWLSLMIFCFMGMASIAALVWRATFGFVLSYAAAPIGASFAFITLVTGSIWGKPIWGTWWVWDARLTSMLVLFIFYCCYIFVATSSANIHRIQKPASVIAILGMINIPIVKFSVDLWYSLHQPASILRGGGPAIDSSMLVPLFLMFFANLLLFIILLNWRVQIIMRRF